MKDNKKRKDEYVFTSPLDLLKNYNEKEEIGDFKEVLFTFGEEEIVKDSGKYYLASTKFPEVNKEISMETATEMWQSFNMKTRDDVSVNFETDINL